MKNQLRHMKSIRKRVVKPFFAFRDRRRELMAKAEKRD